MDYPTTMDIENDSSSSADAEEGLQESKAKEREETLQQIKSTVQKESRRVLVFRTLLILSLLSVGGVFATLTHYVLSQGFNKDAKDAFSSFASGIGDSFHFAVFEIFEANRAISQMISTSALEHGEQFPFFSVPFFEVKAHAAREQASFEVVTFAPVVTGWQKEEYLKFTNETRSWYDESKALYDQLSPGEERSAEPATPPLPLNLWKKLSNGNFVVDESSTIAIPSLHVSPPPPLDQDGVYQNINLWSDDNFREVTLASLTLKDAVFSKFDDVYKEYPAPPTHDYRHPHSIAAQPIFDRLGINNSTKKGSKVVGYIYSVINWGNYLDNLLPEGVNGVVVTLRNSCGQAFTYRLDGNQAAFLGQGDQHEARFDSWMKTIDFADNYFDAKLTSSQKGHCQIFLDVYPSASFLNTYTSSLPLIFSIVVAGLFVIMAFLFALYDRYVRVRNRKVVGAAARSSAIVTSLFPSNVRDRLADYFDDGGVKDREPRFFEMRGSKTSADSPSSSHDNPRASRPLADFFPETTVMFADIVGFTEFSSTREPWEVFTLLETLYQAFDRIACHQGIYKVETIGDCYVAATGLPNPRRDHAIAMAKFAKAILKRMHTLAHGNLAAELGQETRDLTLRIGLHSGPVTAGVLRGERSRFQLFGDTMNTASRMESNSLPGRIQVSQETADHLIRGGKDHWLAQREDKIQAKGKGELTTFWLALPMLKGSSLHQGAGSSNSSETVDVADGEESEFAEDTNGSVFAIDRNRLFEKLAKSRPRYELDFEETTKAKNDQGDAEERDNLRALYQM